MNTLEEIIRKNKEYLNEYAYGRHNFIRYFEDRYDILIAHLIMIQYGKKNGFSNKLIGHWKGEVKGIIFKPTTIDTKPYSNNRNMVYRALIYAWNGVFDGDNKADRMFSLIKAKLRKENINIPKQNREIYVEYLEHIMPQVIYLMAYGNEESIFYFSENL